MNIRLVRSVFSIRPILSGFKSALPGHVCPIKILAANTKIEEKAVLNYRKDRYNLADRPTLSNNPIQCNHLQTP